MGAYNNRKICIVPNLTGVSGMVSFKHKFTMGLVERGIEVSYNLDDISDGSILVIGGTRQIHGLWRARQKGARIIQRLNGLNWIHRIRNTGLCHFIKAEYGNIVLQLIRSRLAHGIIYQSQFAYKWWERTYGPVGGTNSVVYNGVDLQTFKPGDKSTLPADRIRILLVEGRMEGGYETGLENAFQLGREIKSRSKEIRNGTFPEVVELTIVGRVNARMKAVMKGDNGLTINWLEHIPHEHIPEIDRSAHMLFSADINAACPNAVIEALACGTPVVAFDTGALPELVGEHAGKIVPYGGNPWRLELPDISTLAEAAIEVYLDQPNFRTGARDQAEREFSLDTMVDGYLKALFE
jgi:glycosyltransferase involved in cell wall biosynthesis